MKKLHEQKSIINPEAYNLILKNKYPDAKKHKQVSFIKSVVRIIGYGLLFCKCSCSSSCINCK